MARWRVRELAEVKGITTAYRLHLAAGIPLASAQGIWSGKSKRLDLETLDKIAQALGVEPGELISSGKQDSHILTLVNAVVSQAAALTSGVKPALSYHGISVI